MMMIITMTTIMMRVQSAHSYSWNRPRDMSSGNTKKNILNYCFWSAWSFCERNC
uniref:Uncharacterized protein n=1 Tax=Anguilla anguilla TaxID=7936 RepID=A0A0E9WHY4_ANGAN